ncbi:MAG: ABC transporter ATP-binding protein [Candidatus Brockarchaeota archaeon]|nr:ABC transporter ATP-binding protein [Candidatus Brockarchaeota archaeon]MBO3768068.1 ABC transporter ATP-binding protein [Candidatus Brockarchaeota archaeon]MBO3802243.1 ABC transporter ATP-binding protein [Candidatus Brockarchaeota archaeon]
MNTTVTVSNIFKSFGKVVAINGLSFEVREGEIVGLLGPNGAGKTTTVRIISTIIKPDKGEVTVSGFNVVTNPKEVRNEIGVVFENANLYEKLSVADNLQFFGELHGLRAFDLKQRIFELLELFGLKERARDKVATLSKGMKQKLSIAIALVHNPKILILDEPTSGLDVPSARSLRDMIKRIVKEKRKSVILCTHNMLEAQYLSDRIVLMNKGKKVVEGTPEELEKMSGVENLEEVFLHLIKE